MKHDGVALPQPPMLRGMQWAREKLEKAGNVEVVDFEPYKHQYAWDLIVRSSSPFLDATITDERSYSARCTLKTEQTQFDENSLRLMRTFTLSVATRWMEQ
jgi:hypothetical protein